MHTGIQKGNTKCCVICHAVFFSFFTLIKRVWIFVKISIRLAILPWPKPQCWKFLGCCKCDNFWSTVALPVSDHTFTLALILALFKPVFKMLLDNTHHSVLTSYQFCWLWPILKVTAAFWRWTGVAFIMCLVEFKPYVTLAHRKFMCIVCLAHNMARDWCVFKKNKVSICGLETLKWPFSDHFRNIFQTL